MLPSFDIVYRYSRATVLPTSSFSNKIYVRQPPDVTSYTHKQAPKSVTLPNFSRNEWPPQSHRRANRPFSRTRRQEACQTVHEYCTCAREHAPTTAVFDIIWRLESVAAQICSLACGPIELHLGWTSCSHRIVTNLDITQLDRRTLCTLSKKRVKRSADMCLQQNLPHSRLSPIRCVADWTRMSE